MRRRAFVLLEAMIAVAIFAIGVLALGRCVNNCMAAERLKEEDALARQALENRMAEIEADAVSGATSSSETLGSPYEGMKLKQSSVPLKRKNEKGQDLSGLFAVTLSVTWASGGEPQERSLTLHVLPRKQ